MRGGESRIHWPWCAEPKKRQRTAALQNLAESVAPVDARQRHGVRLSSAAFGIDSNARQSGRGVVNIAGKPRLTEGSYQMPERCNKCGIAALESQSFIEENFPFMRRRFYCFACHQRLVYRICIGFTVVIVAIAAVATFDAVRMQEPILNYPGFSILFLVVVQWLLTVPHELGHAIAARLLGYEHIRILIGAGKTLVSFELAGFYWVINAIPFGGLTIANAPAKPRRWKEFILVSAGLAVNAALALAAWFYIGPGGLFYLSGNAAKLF